MNIKEINKGVYRKHLNQIIISFIVVLALLSLLFGTLLITAFGMSPEQIANGETNFRYNLLGVILALIACSALIYKLRTRQFFHEVYYVWQLKQIQNLIYRKLAKIKAAVKSNDVNAFIILQYYYESLIFVYHLDDNLLTLTELSKKQQQLQQNIEDKQLTILSSQFDKSLLKMF